MRALFDTSVLIDHLRGVAKATKVLEDTANNGVELWSVSVVRTEILAGMRPDEAEPTYNLLNVLRWQVVDTDVADRAGALAREYLPTFRHIDTVDFIIAAAAGLLNARLLTLNTKHFPMFPNLTRAY